MRRSWSADRGEEVLETEESAWAKLGGAEQRPLCRELGNLGA